MAKKKTSSKTKAKKKATAPGSKQGEKVVFAFRLSPQERDTIHKAAGPRGASRFVLEAALAAAKTQK